MMAPFRCVHPQIETITDCFVLFRVKNRVEALFLFKKTVFCASKAACRGVVAVKRPQCGEQIGLAGKPFLSEKAFC